MIIRIVNRSNNSLPAYETAHAAGMDLRADTDETIVLKPMERKLIPTGLFIELPEGFEAQIRPRSGLAFKHGIGIVNSPGTIDADYRGEVKVLLINFSIDDFQINHGDRIAQMVVAKHEKVNWDQVEILNETTRGEGGFGHTAVK
ncbi:dUTP diphosphatase [Mucilaginibacter aquaedulcis]|uniref:dUTP diphosphatase n=1 Tax=Mucilaginibacter aquaedulcis TaxID=1187081 RepID=UPI0025B573CF|nr:dUTP diphosphatase [Mucilaginibacter aquaedulcis]MDN3551811.1 dUTP diphosphatase [Mucilaginibacter aquaedulcis]